MKNLKAWQKLVVMGVEFMIPFAVATWRLIASVNTLGVEFEPEEIKGVGYDAPAFALLPELPLPRGLAHIWLNGASPGLKASIESLKLA
jgi:hypothetical protein